MHFFLTMVGICLLIPATPLTLELFCLTLAALFSPRARNVSSATVRLAVVIPAHNEELLIAACVTSLRPTAAPVYVVAHNCTDATARNAKAAGAAVLELNEDSGHGKGAALQFGFAHALAAGAEAVLVIDADSIASPNLLPSVASALAAGAGAVQARYVAANPQAGAGTRLRALALRGMNVVRPRGRWRLGLSCGIFGNGFALSKQTLQLVPYEAHSIVEDLEYHLALVRAGIRVEFLDNASVRGELPDNTQATATQSVRWEGGRKLIRHEFARKLLRDVLKGHVRFLEPLVDLLSLPLAKNTVLLLLAFLTPLRAWAEFGLGTVVFYVLVSVFFGETPLRDLLALAGAPFYVAGKIMTMGRTRRAAEPGAAWVRTERNQKD